MRRKLAAGNWKMNGLAADLSEIEALAAAHPAPRSEVLVCPPATLIAQMAWKARGSAVMVGGQDCHARPSGAHTGDIAAAMLTDAGASHVILGHSERRADHGETDALVRAKAGAADAAGLVAVICVGETEAERDRGATLEVVSAQLEGSIPADATAEHLVVAYEPVWAIGTGKTPTPDDVAAVHAHIRGLLTAWFKDGAEMRVLYGGSVKAANAAVLMHVPEVNGALVGGASLKAEDFWGIALGAA